MNLKREKERYPFIIADEEGKVLLSAPENAFREENIFSPDNIDRADILFIGECIRTFVLDSPIAVQSGDGKLWIVSLAAFPSARVFYVIVTDLEYDKAVPIIEQSFK
ncbi:MAG: hypothetical protein U0M06_10725, partial [Clostridia bacterium]|nr:hypothetical protein [Clostridia bacterium]